MKAGTTMVVLGSILIWVAYFIPPRGSLIEALAMYVNGMILGLLLGAEGQRRWGSVINEGD